MTHAATMGTFSCATMSIGSFKGNNRELNESYKKDPKSWATPKEGLSVEQFSSQILYPTSQPLGRTHDMPFEKLMQDIKKILPDKLISATLNETQFMGNDHYWPKELKRHGFRLMAKTRNSWGQLNYVYMAIPREEKIQDKEHM